VLSRFSLAVTNGACATLKGRKPSFRSLVGWTWAVPMWWECVVVIALPSGVIHLSIGSASKWLRATAQRNYQGSSKSL